MPLSKLGPYSTPAHWGRHYEAGIRDWSPRGAKVMDYLPGRAVDMHRQAPRSLLVLRDFPLSDQHDDMWRNPTATGIRHADEWAQHIEQWKLPIPRNQLVLLGINEPEVWRNEPAALARAAGLSPQQAMIERRRESLEALHRVQAGDLLPGTRGPQAWPRGVAVATEYSVAFLDRCRHNGYRGGALQLAVGWPANTGPETPPVWDPYQPVYDAIRRGNHFLVVHEYWNHTGPQSHWGWLAGRYEKCPWNVPIIVGETGIEEGVTDMSKFSWGWQRWYNDRPQVYLDQLYWYDQQLIEEPRIAFAAIYMLDFVDRYWAYMDITPLLGKLKRNDDFDLYLNWQSQPLPEHPVPIPPDGLRRALLEEAEKRQVIQFNPDASLQKAIFRDGFVPNSGEFQVVHGGTTYVAQRAERLQDGAVRVYHVPKGRWDQVKSVTR